MFMIYALDRTGYTRTPLTKVCTCSYVRSVQFCRVVGLRWELCAVYGARLITGSIFQAWALAVYGNTPGIR